MTCSGMATATCVSFYKESLIFYTSCTHETWIYSYFDCDCDCAIVFSVPAKQTSTAVYCISSRIGLLTETYGLSPVNPYVWALFLFFYS